MYLVLNIKIYKYCVFFKINWNLILISAFKIYNWMKNEKHTHKHTIIRLFPLSFSLLIKILNALLSHFHNWMIKKKSLLIWLQHFLNWIFLHKKRYQMISRESFESLLFFTWFFFKILTLIVFDNQKETFNFLYI